MRLGIIGMGAVGSSLAYTLMREEWVTELVLIDKKETLAVAEALELEDCLSQLATNCKFICNDFSALSKAEAVVISVAEKVPEESDRLAELVNNQKEIKEVIPKLNNSGFAGQIVVVTNPCDVITTLVQKLSSLPAEKVIGTGTNLDSMRLKRIVAKELNVNPHDVQGCMLGEHGESQLAPWSFITYQNQAIQDIITDQNKLNNLEQTVRAGGWLIFKERGYTNYGIAVSTAAILKAILLDYQQIFPVSVYDIEHDVYYSRPAVLEKSGVNNILPLTITEDETAKLNISIERIKSAFDTIN